MGKYSIGVYIILCFIIGTSSFAANAQEDTEQSLHPAIKLLDSDGNLVQESGNPISTRKTCGGCHDYDFISKGYHSQQGRLELRKWKHRVFPYFLSRGMYGKWCSMPNRQLAPLDVKSIADFDLGTPEWIRSCGTCHVGGGITEFDRRNRKYTDVKPEEISEMDPDYHYYSPKKKKLVKWDWEESGVAEVDCFLCHIKNFNRVSRDEQIRGGYFSWASTGTLDGTGIVENDIGELVYKNDAFNDDGTVKNALLKLQDPAPENCGQCHGFVGLGENANKINPFFSHELLRGTKKFGRVWSSGLIKDSDVNLVGKEKMDFPWDIHAAKKVKCIDCHFSVNNPASKIRDSRKVDHLKYRPVDFDLETYLKRPDHSFAKGHSFPESIREEHECTMRSCNECHDTSKLHKWLPFRKRHLMKIGCETCHIPRKNYWAYKQLDMSLSAAAVTKVRGTAPGEDFHDLKAKVVGFQPAYFPRTCKDLIPRITPQNLITSLFWFDTVKKRPAFKYQLNEAFKQYDSLYKLHYKPEMIAVFDRNKDGKLDKSELKIDTVEKYEFARKRLESVGVQDPELRMEILPFSMAHNVVGKGHALKDCTQCHSSRSRLSAPMEVFDYAPQNVDIDVSPVVDVKPVGPGYEIRNGKIYYDSSAYLKDYYIIGADHTRWVEILGWLSVFGTVFGAVIHGSSRLIISFFKNQ